MAATACARELMRRLGAAGSWLDRIELADGLAERWSEAQLDDELADLVVHGVAEFAERGRRYRLAGAPIARLALYRLLGSADADDVVAIGRATADGQTYRLGIARRVRRAAEEGGDWIVMAALEMPYPPEGPAEIARLAQLIDRSLAS